MARRSVTGQLNMFELFHSLDHASAGEVEMVSLMPSFEEEPVVEETPAAEESAVVEETPVVEETSQEVKAVELPVETQVGADKPVMSRTYEVQGEKIEVAYLNYNKVRITKAGKEPEVKVFSSSKEAVDYYVLMMQEWEKDEE